MTAPLIACCIGLGCHKPQAQPVTISFLDPEWSHDNASDRRAAADSLIQKFVAETGIHVNHLPAPETSRAQLALTLELLQRKAGSPDVFAIDVIGAGIVGDYLIDLKQEFADQLASQDPNVIQNYTTRGRLVAVPYHTNVAILFYRRDLLTRYGLSEPPRTWDELESMSGRIQMGERARGKKEFWGYVWPGAASEALTCVGLEWQFDEGGGRIIESDGKISVNNAQTLRSWERARQWIGSISSPSVTSYQEWDATNAVDSGRAAFGRVWTSDYFLSQPIHDPSDQILGNASLPGGAVYRSTTLGGIGLAVSRYSSHPAESIKLIHFLLREEARLELERARKGLPKTREFYNLPSILRAYSPLSRPDKTFPSVIVARPSTVTGSKYGAVSIAYARSLHSVLSGDVEPSTALSNLENELRSITGFPAKPKGSH